MKILLSDDGKRIIGVEINGDSWYLKNPQQLSELEELTKHVKYVVEHFAFGSEREWTDAELESFLGKELTDGQKLFLTHLAQSDKWVSIDELVNLHKSKFGNAVGVTIAGLQAPITRKCRTLKKENFWESDYFEQEEKNYYRIKPKYKDIVKHALVTK